MYPQNMENTLNKKEQESKPFLMKGKKLDQYKYLFKQYYDLTLL